MIWQGNNVELLREKTNTDWKQAKEALIDWSLELEVIQFNTERTKAW